MSRKYSSWALTNDFSRMKLTTVNGNEQDQLKTFDRVESIPHMYINIDAPPPPTGPVSIMRTDSHALQPKLNASFVSAPSTTSGPVKLWPMDQSGVSDGASSHSKRKHKHHHHHHHHHGDKHHHHHHRRRHHSRHHRATSAESIRNRVQPNFISADPSMQQQQPQQMIVYREGYPAESNPATLATVPYMANEQEIAYHDDQQAPMFVYRDSAPPIIQNDGTSQHIFIQPEQETRIAQSTVLQQPIQQNLVSSQVTPCRPRPVASLSMPPYIEEIERIYVEDDCCQVPRRSIPGNSCFVQSAEPTSQIVYCTEPPMHQEFLCTSPPPPVITQPQFVCMESPSNTTTIQPTMINQIPVFNTATTPSMLTSVSGPTSVVLPQQVVQSAPAQFIQVSSQSPQLIQTVPAPILQMPVQTVATATPQVLYQRPYDPVVLPVQNQQIALATTNAPAVVGLSQPSYAPARLLPTTTTAPVSNAPGPNMFRHALLRTVADRTGVPLATANPSAQVVQASPNVLLGSDNLQRSASLPIVPLSPGGLLIPFQPNLSAGRRAGPFPRLGGYPSALKNFQDIRQQIEQRSQLLASLPRADRAPSPPVLSTGSLGKTPYTSPLASLAPASPAGSGPYGRTGLNYSPPSLSGSVLSGQTNPYRIVRP